MPERHLNAVDVEVVGATERYGVEHLLVESSFFGLVAVAHKLLEKYPDDVAVLCHRDSPDPGPRFVYHLREALKAVEGIGL